MTVYTTAGKVNKALKAAGIEIEIVKGNGYFWFDNRYPETNPLWKVTVDSLEGEWPRLSSTPEQIVEHVQKALDAYVPYAGTIRHVLARKPKE